MGSTAAVRAFRGQATASPTDLSSGSSGPLAGAPASRSRLRVGGASGQAAVEVLSYAAFFLLIFVATVAVFFQQQTQELTRAENAYAQEIAYGFSDQIHTAFVAGPGFVQNITIQRDLLGKPYNISVSRSSAPANRETGFVYVAWRGAGGPASFSAPTITTSYQATTVGDYITVDGDFIIINSQYAGQYGYSLRMRNTYDGSPGVNRSVIWIEHG